MAYDLAIVTSVKEVSSAINSVCTTLKTVGSVSVTALSTVSAKATVAKDLIRARGKEALLEEHLNLIEKAANHFATKDFRYDFSRIAAEKELNMLNEALMRDLDKYYRTH